MWNVLFGLRGGALLGRVRAFAEALFGAVYARGMFAVALKSDTSFAQVLGGGVDFRLMRLLSWRIQADEIETGSPAFERRIFAWPPKWQFDFDVLGTSDGEEPSLCGKMVSFEPQAHEIGTGRRIDCEELD